MTLANPDVKSATANYVSPSTEVLVLFSNPGGYGWTRLEAVQGNTVKGAIERCVAARAPLTFLESILLDGLVQPINYIKAYKCNSDSQQNCDATPPTCTASVLTSNFDTGGLYPITYNSTAPGTPAGLTITAGDRKLDVAWNPVSDPSGLNEVFAYYLAVYEGSTKKIGGWIQAGTTSVSVSGLVNGTTYTVYVSSVSHSNVTGTPASGTGTPAAPCPELQTNLAVV